MWRTCMYSLNTRVGALRGVTVEVVSTSGRIHGEFLRTFFTQDVLFVLFSSLFSLLFLLVRVALQMKIRSLRCRIPRLCHIAVF